MLKITLHDSAQELRFKLEGRLSGPWVAELRQCWLTAQSTVHDRKTVLDLAELDFVDPQGQSLLEDMHRQGVTFVAMSPLIRAILDAFNRSQGCDTVEAKPSHVARSPVTAKRGSGTI